MEQSIAEVCIVGVGAVGGILAKELTSAGLKVVGFERGPAPHLEDYSPRDSIKFIARTDQLDWVRHEPTTFRSKPGDVVQLRYRTSPLNVLGGALLYWTGQASRFMPDDFKLFTNEIESGVAERPACVYCGHCNFYGCHVHAKAATLYTTIPVAVETGNFDLKTNCKVFRVNANDAGQVTGVAYFDPDGRIKEQRARVVILSAFVFENVRLLLLSKTDAGPFSKGLANSSGLVGRYILAHGDVRAYGLFDDFIINGFIGPGSAAMRIDDFNGNNLDHTGLGFMRGGTIGTSGEGTPVTRMDVVPPGVRRWGKEYKDYFTRYYTRTFDLNMQPETLPHQANRVDLDPGHRDRWGVRVPRVTFDFHQNERRLQRFMGQVGEKIMSETGARKVWSGGKERPNRWAAPGWARTHATLSSTSFARPMIF